MDRFSLALTGDYSMRILLYYIRFERNEAISHLKNVFWPLAFFGGIGALFQILDIQQYACGLKLGPAAILNQNPIFEMPSTQF